MTAGSTSDARLYALYGQRESIAVLRNRLDCILAQRFAQRDNDVG